MDERPNANASALQHPGLVDHPDSESIQGELAAAGIRFDATFGIVTATFVTLEELAPDGG